MRQILVDHARAHVAAKRGGPAWKLPLAEDLGATLPRDVDLLDLDAALRKLETINSRLGELVVLRFFGGMTVEEAAEGLGLSPATVTRDWSRARALAVPRAAESGSLSAIRSDRAGRWTQAEGPHPPCTHRTNDRE